MVLVLDANEYIFAFDVVKNPKCEKLLELIRDTHSIHSVRMTRLILNEVRANLSRETFKKFIQFLNAFATLDEDFSVPFELGKKYEVRGLKPADALIAAYAEWVKADILVSENRHFLTRQKNLPFKVRSAEQALRLLR